MLLRDNKVLKRRVIRSYEESKRSSEGRRMSLKGDKGWLEEAASKGDASIQGVEFLRRTRIEVLIKGIMSYTGSQDKTVIRKGEIYGFKRDVDFADVERSFKREEASGREYVGIG